jgi:hypothetical protein
LFVPPHDPSVETAALAKLAESRPAVRERKSFMMLSDKQIAMQLMGYQSRSKERQRRVYLTTMRTRSTFKYRTSLSPYLHVPSKHILPPAHAPNIAFSSRVPVSISLLTSSSVLTVLIRAYGICNPTGIHDGRTRIRGVPTACVLPMRHFDIIASGRCCIRMVPGNAAVCCQLWVRYGQCLPNDDVGSSLCSFFSEATCA